VHLEDSVRNVRVGAAWALRSTLREESRAARDLRRVLDFNADQPAGQMQKGVYYFSRRELQPALQHLQTAVAWDPQSPPFRHELAVVLSVLGRPAEALEQLSVACRLAPQDAELRYKLGLAYNELGDRPGTVAALEAAIKLDPRHARAWYNLGLAQNELGQSSAALESLLRAESIELEDPRIPYARATILARLARRPEARAAVRRALELQPGYADAQELLEALPP
jgi:tetratricopeptide (TPR) repeat protein